MSLGGSIRGVRPGMKALRNEREILVDPDREAKLQMYQRRAEIGVPLFDPDQVAVEIAPEPVEPRRKRTTSRKRKRHRPTRRR